MATAELAVAGYEFISTLTRTGRTVHQLETATVVAKDGKIQLLREVLNLAELALAIFFGGLGDVKLSDDRERRIGMCSDQDP